MLGPDTTLLYLDQNYASRIAKFGLGMPDHEHFGEFHEALIAANVVVPVSPFHVLELRGGYLTPPFQSFFPLLSRGYWVRSWQDILQRQWTFQRVDLEDFLSRDGDWETPATIEPLASIVELELEGTFREREVQADTYIRSCLEEKVPGDAEAPFLDVLARLLVFRSLNTVRQPQPSDLIDLLMAATVRPYVVFLGTDRFLREGLERIGEGEGVFSGRRHEVVAFSNVLSSLPRRTDDLQTTSLD